LGAAACSDDSGGDDDAGGGSTSQAAFCDRLTELAEDEALDLDGDRAIEAFEELQGIAPEEIEPSLDAMHDAFAALAELDQDDPDQADEALDILFDDDLIEATTRFGEYAEEECGIEGVGDAEIDGLSDAFSDDLSDGFTDDLTDEGPNVSDRLRTFLEAEHADLAAMVEGIGSVDISADEAQVTLTVGDEPADVETGVAICEAVVDFAEQDGLAAIDIEVENDENGDDALLATGDLDDGCEAA
jgi:hypothetical protein